ncbi:cardiolipin synthase [Eubacterium xylanophilum]|uniref:cardiolipin synthase n=1 Tax=Eubacterium xylanophilum TaxID=39497 RepID=UPI0004AC79F1|nr:cardiolipin synthase [Eubacterium xylanophilum]
MSDKGITKVKSSRSGGARATIVAILVIVQCLVVIIPTLFLREYGTIAFVVLEICNVLGIILLSIDNRSLSYKFSWMSAMLIFPISGLIMFMLWGHRRKQVKLNAKIAEKSIKNDKYQDYDRQLLDRFSEMHPVSSRMTRYMYAMGSPLYANNDVKYYSTGESVIDAMIEDLEQAKDFILMEFFIVAEGEVWNRVHEILVRKAREGVEVNLIVDDFGSMFRTSVDFAERLEEEGINIRIFNPIHKYFHNFYMNFRTHEKIVVIDGTVAYTGGFNLADEYANLIERFGYWKDAGIRVKGDVVKSVVLTFMDMWMAMNDNDIDVTRYLKDDMGYCGEKYCHALKDGPAYRTYSYVENVYEQMINYAGSKLYIMTPYLILPEKIMQDLIEARIRGVDVRIITPGIPDKKYVKRFTEYNYGNLLKAGIRVFEYEQGFVHSKVIMNEHCAVVGSINMDYRSFYLHFENGIWVYDKEFTAEVNEDIENTFGKCREISYEQWLQRPIKHKAYQAFFNILSPLI